jgi:hypothetical protein
MGVVLILILLAAGCSQIGGSPSTPTDAPEYHGNASEYLLTAEEVGDGWEENQTRPPDADAPAMESGRVIQFRNGSDEFQIAVLIFESDAEAESFYEDQRDTYVSEGFSIVNQTIGERARSISTLDQNLVDSHTSNVYVQVTGDVQLDSAKRHVEEQLGKITNGSQ